MEIIDMQFILAVIMAIFIGGLGGFLGSLMITKRMALMGGALGHLALPGIATAIYFNIDISIGALAFLIIGIILIWLISLITKTPTEAITAVVFPAAMATTFLFLPKNKAIPALIGNISSITINSAIITIITSLVILIFLKIIFKKLILISISQDIANVQGINVKLYNLLYLICVTITIALGVRIVGGLMTAALVAIPASSSKNLTNNLFSYSLVSTIVGIFSCGFGVFFSKYTSIPAGPLIIIISSFIFLLSLIIKVINIKK